MHSQILEAKKRRAPATEGTEVTEKSRAWLRWHETDCVYRSLEKSDFSFLLCAPVALAITHGPKIRSMPGYGPTPIIVALWNVDQKNGPPSRFPREFEA